MVYTIIDIETTGFNRESDNILEVGYIKTNKWCEILGSGSFYFYKPEFKIENQAQRVHHLSREFLEQYEKDFNINLTRLYSMMYNGIIIGKNNKRFDIPFIQAFLRRYAVGLDHPCEIMGYVDLQEKYVEPFREYYYKKYGARTNKKGTLEELISMVGYNTLDLQTKFSTNFPESQRREKHAALFDVYMTYLLLKDSCENRGLQLNI